MAMGGTAWDRQNTANPQNLDRSRWYGIRPGDVVTMSFGGWTGTGEVKRLHGGDNNGCTLRVKGREMKGVCEWCTIVKKVEDR